MTVKKYFSFLNSHLSTRKGFTLIELLVVIAVIGILAAGVFAALDPVDKVNAANDSRGQTDVATIASAEETYAVNHSGFYTDRGETTGGAGGAALIFSGELKNIPAAIPGYTLQIWSASASTADAAGFPTATSTCTSGVDCTTVVITTNLKSKKYTQSGFLFQRYESKTGETCQVALRATPC